MSEINTEASGFTVALILNRKQSERGNEFTLPHLFVQQIVQQVLFESSKLMNICEQDATLTLFFVGDYKLES